METINIHSITSEFGKVDFHLWQDGEGDWYSCRSGEFNDVMSESEDLGPFDTRQEALDAQHDDFNEFVS